MLIKRFFIMTLLFFMIIFVGCSVDESNKVESEIDDNTYEENEVKDDIDDNVHGEDEVKDEIDGDPDKTETKRDNLTVHYIDADQGDATLFQYDEFTIMYDTGDWKNEHVINYLHQVGIEKIDLIIISHPHADHIGQLDKIINSFSVDEVWMTENVANSDVFHRAINAILENDIDFYEPEAGELFDIGNMEVLVLHPKTLTGDLNEDSIAIRFTYGDISFVFTGDAYKKQEQLIVKENYPLEADFLRLGHHGSNTSSDPAFIQAVNPTYAIYSAGANNSYGHPHSEVVNYFNGTNMTLLGTDVHGTIKVETDGKTYNVTTEKKAKQITPTSQKDPKQKKQEKLEQEPSNESTNNENCIDINNASHDELKTIIHIGDERAKELIKYRPYKSVDELTKIKGIGDSRLNDIKTEGNACVN